MTNYYFFWNDPLSNWHPSTYELNGTVFSCTEQGLMYEKAKLFDPYMIPFIMQTSNPKSIKMLGRKIRNFNESVWVEHREALFYPHLVEKYKQNKDLFDILLSTGNKDLVEASPYDRIWGIGFNESNAEENIEKWGLNLLGKMLIRVRSELT